MRSDEKAALAEIERNERFERNVKKGIKTGASLATAGVGIGSGIVSQGIKRVLPFLSDFINPEMAIKGISQVNPKLGNILKQGQKAGLNIQDGLNFLREKLSGEAQTLQEIKETKEPPKSANENPIEALVPDLHTHIVQQVSKGMNPLDALHTAKSPVLQPQVELIAKKLGPKLFDALTRFYSPEALGIVGQSKAALQPSGQAFENAPPQVPPQPQMGKGEQALTAILQQINQKLGGNR